MITSDNVWVVYSSRQGVMRPVKREVIEIVEDIEVIDYEGTAKPKPITGHHRQLDIICPECNNVMDGDECISMDNRMHERHILECTECKIEFEVALHTEVTYSSSTNVTKFLDKQK